MKILVIRYKKCLGVPEGGEKASELNLHVLKQLAGDNSVDTCFIHDHTRRRSALQSLWGLLWMPLGYHFGLNPRRVKHLVNQAQSYDVVFIDRSVFGILAKHLKANGYRGRIICFFHNVESIYFSAKYANRLHPLRWITMACANRNDRYGCRYADRTIVLSRRDDEELYRRYGRHADQIIPIAFVDRYRRTQYADTPIGHPPLCMFLGACLPANVEGIEWFVRKVLPLVEIRMQIVGKGMDQLSNASWMQPGIEILSDVADLEPLFEAADLMVLPIFKGSGMKVKTCESLMYGKNILGTPEAWSGYEIDYSQAGACCETAEECIAFLHRFSNTPRPRFNAYSRQMFEDHYSADRMVDKFRAILEQ